ncbi:homoserine dehydrogenase [Brevundimonas sp.]|uniref:homoserine dehydrogenase n=1 Tax=Brevundimonas sp. TaxID=1871086 RepID=UPI002737C563|nr:hypothetical protein [Brevundimonas sp.]MDP3802960.1 hypothetical protein [Brevundimonas sp.]
MSALALTAPGLPAIPPGDAPPTEEPVVLLQLDATVTAEAVSSVYREVRRGRRVVVVAGGDSGAPERLALGLDAVGVVAALPTPGEALFHAGVAIVAGPSAPPTRIASTPTRLLRVALAGCGVVGGGVLERLLADPRFEVVGVLVRHPGKRRDVPIPAGLALSDPAALLAREPDILVEAISEASTGLALVRAALSRGVDVVSANKQAISADLPALARLAGDGGVRLLYSASVGGGAPLIETVRRARSHGAVARIEAVLNGTCNFILNRLAEGLAFDAALSAAKEAGFAEADPSADLTGLDAVAKLAILAHEAGLGRLEANGLTRETLAGNATLPTGEVRQLARLDVRTGEAGVAFRAVGGDALFAGLPDEWNALRVTTADGRVFTARGRGAGRIPTTESVWADLVDLVESGR